MEGQICVEGRFASDGVLDWEVIGICFSHCFMAVKKHHNQGNSYKKKSNELGACLQF